MKWTDVYDIAMALTDTHPDTDPQYVSFVDLHRWICELEAFDDDPTFDRHLNSQYSVYAKERHYTWNCSGFVRFQISKNP